MKNLYTIRALYRSVFTIAALQLFSGCGTAVEPVIELPKVGISGVAVDPVDEPPVQSSARGFVRSPVYLDGSSATPSRPAITYQGLSN